MPDFTEKKTKAQSSKVMSRNQVVSTGAGIWSKAHIYDCRLPASWFPVASHLPMTAIWFQNFPIVNGEITKNVCKDTEAILPTWCVVVYNVIILKNTASGKEIVYKKNLQEILKP